jgi:bifunctional non-homologous end joining protein LigD
MTRLEKMKSPNELQIDGKTIPVSNLDKVLYPSCGFTKGEIIDYYIRISRFLLPHLKDRPLSLKRYPGGVEKEYFYEKRCPPYRPKWVKTIGMWSEGNQETIHFCAVDNLPSLVWAANLANLELHTYLCKRQKLTRPTVVAFDLDPGEGANVLNCASLAIVLRSLCKQLGLECFVKTSGSKGLQVYIPLNTDVTFDATKQFAKTIAEQLVKQFPAKVTADMKKSLRHGKVFVDWSQNDQHKTTVCVYSLRGKEQPTVSTPLKWSEVQSAIEGKSADELVFTSSTVLERTKRFGDLFAPVLTLKQKLPTAKSVTKALMQNTAADLGQYKRKRDFRQSPEPSGDNNAIPDGTLFVIQKHAASHLHYDFRLEVDGVLKSWAVPKGLPLRKGEKRLAIQVEDHPLDYARFEGTIPKGNYGGGTVMVWDIGTYAVTDKDIGEVLKSGSIHLRLTGKKLRGDWTLVRLKKAEEKKQPWLFFKSGSDHKGISSKAEDRSALSNRSMAEISKADDAQWDSKKGRSLHAPDFIAELRGLPKAKPAFIEPMKARLVERLPSDSGWLYEIKFDGVRALAIKDGKGIKLVSRTRHSLDRSFPEVLDALEHLPYKSYVLDGEVVALDDKGRSSFQLLQPFIQAEDSPSARPAIVMYLFDVLNLEGKSTMALPLLERKKLIEKLLQKTTNLLRVSGTFQENPKKLLKQIEKLGLEGLVGKRPTSRYESGKRSGAWIKLKVVQEQEFIIGGYTQPRGSREYFGSLIVGFQKDGKLRYASKVGTGFDSRSLRLLFTQLQKLRMQCCPFVNLPSKKSDENGLSLSDMKHCTWMKPKLVCQVRFSEWTKDEHLRQPVYLGLRNDKHPREVERESRNA